MITDEQIAVIARDVDDVLAGLVTKHKIGPLSLSGIMLARLIHFANHDDDIYKLFSEIGKKTHLENSEVVH